MPVPPGDRSTRKRKDRHDADEGRVEHDAGVEIGSLVPDRENVQDIYPGPEGSGRQRNSWATILLAHIRYRHRPSLPARQVKSIGRAMVVA